MNDLKFAFRQLLKNPGFVAVAVLLFSAAASSKLTAQNAVTTPSAARSRPFRMGFTAFPHDITPEAVSQTRQFVHTNADLIAHHIEGVPWAESLRNEPFPKELVNDRERKRSMTPPGAKVYLAVSPGRGELKLAEKGTTPLPAELIGKTYDDPLVKKAYLNYCRRSIEFFKPDYLAIGIEVNEIFSVGKDKWRAYVELHRDVYRELKKEHPHLPIFASYTLHNLIKARGEMVKACQELMPFNDLVAISFYPFFISESPEVAFQWLLERFDQFGKPYAMVETNDTAERLQFPKSKLVALGAQRRDVLSLVVGKGLKLALIGSVIGLAGALGATRLVSNLLYGVTPADPLTFVGVALIFLFVALRASWLPARRATKVDPMEALRCQ